MQRLLAGLIVVVVALGVVGCKEAEAPANDEAAVQNTQEPGETPTLLLAMKESDFKKAVANSLTQRLAEEGYSVDTMKLDQVDTAALGDYAAVIILDAARPKNFTAAGKAVFEAADKDKVVVMLTKKPDQEDWKPNVEGVDAMTAASDMANVEDAVAAMLAQTLEIAPTP